MSLRPTTFTKRSRPDHRATSAITRPLFAAYNGAVRPTAAISLMMLLSGSCTLTGTVGVVEGETETTVGAPDTDEPPGGSGDLLDLGASDGQACTDRGELMGVGPCSQQAPPDSFDAMLRWSWTGPDGDTDSLVIPLVANLTDDDGNGRIDLCDKPDVLVTAGPPPGAPLNRGVEPARLYALDGVTGSLHWASEQRIRGTVTPALADIDGDDRVEIVALAPGTDETMEYPSRLVVFENDGSMAWISAEFDSTWADAVALADLDADGDAEIMVADRVFDSRGNVEFIAAGVGREDSEPLMPFAVNLDGDGDLEVIWARGAYHHDGTPVFEDLDRDHGYAQVADLDRNGTPEIIITSSNGIAILSADGTPQIDPRRPELTRGLNIPAGVNAWRRPAAIHDIDGDRFPDLLMSAGDHLLALHLDVSAQSIELIWDQAIVDGPGAAAGTAFDFLGDGTAEAIYADELMLFALDIDGSPVLETARSSVTLQEYPVVADVDNDGSAEVLVVSNVGPSMLDPPAPTLMVLGEVNDRWVQARRIWNQHTYHVSNVTEDGQLPTPERPHWLTTNTFRTNAQLEGGVVCVPEP